MAHRNSRQEVFCKKVVLRNFAKFTGKHLCKNLFFNKVAGLRYATLLEEILWHRCFPVKFAKFLRTPFLTEHLWWLFLGSVLGFKSLNFNIVAIKITYSDVFIFCNKFIESYICGGHNSCRRVFRIMTNIYNRAFL